MPVIRGQASVTALASERRQALLDQLKQELAGGQSPNGPVIFEIPLRQSDKKDVLVVWPAFRDLRSEDRTQLILDAYQQPEREQIAQALGVTYEEAMEQQLLPYAVVPMTRAGEADPAELRRAMIREGAIVTPAGKVDLRFPTLAMAENAHRKLSESLPKGYWTLSQSVFMNGGTW